MTTRGWRPRQLSLRKAPVSSIGWHSYYANRFNRNQDPDAAYLAMIYMFFALRDEEVSI